jgi:hypothetical protein
MNKVATLDPTKPAFKPAAVELAPHSKGAPPARRPRYARCTSRIRKIVECYDVFQRKHYIEIHLMDYEVLVLGPNEYIQYYAVIRDAYVNNVPIAYLRIEGRGNRPAQVFINTRTLENRKEQNKELAKRYEKEQKLMEARLN